MVTVFGLIGRIQVVRLFESPGEGRRHGKVVVKPAASTWGGQAAAVTQAVRCRKR